MKSISIFIIILGFLISSCSDVKNHTDKTDEISLSIELSDTQEIALDALDIIQLSGEQLYSTYPNIDHDCHANNSTYKISQAQFEDALLDLLNEYYLDTPENKRIDLALKASKAQEEYTFQTCRITSGVLILDESTKPSRIGTWIFQSLLNQRDLIIKWE